MSKIESEKDKVRRIGVDLQKELDEIKKENKKKFKLKKAISNGKITNMIPKHNFWHKIKKPDRDGWADYDLRDVVTLKHFRYWLKNEDFGYEGEGLIDPRECKIIGNIYSNPELLK